jgi:valyl-tRNA synthetase
LVGTDALRFWAAVSADTIESIKIHFKKLNLIISRFTYKIMQFLKSQLLSTITCNGDQHKISMFVTEVLI